MDVNELFFIGHNKYGQGGMGQQQHNKKFNVPKQVIFKVFIKQVSCGNHHSALLTIDGLIYTMGSNIHGTLGLENGHNINYAFRPSLVKDLTDADQIFSGSYHVAALRQGSLYTWGKGIDGQLGHGNCKNLFTPTKVQTLGNQVQMVSCGQSHTLVLTNSQRQFNGYAFGSGIYGQLGSGTNRNSNTPISIKLGHIQQISAGQSHSLFISQNCIYGCGDNSYLQLGSSQVSKSKKYILQPTKIDLTNDQEFNLIDCHSLSVALSVSGKAYVWGGKFKIWPAIPIQNSDIVDFKVTAQKIYILNNDSQIWSYNLSNDKNVQKEIVLKDKNILGFDAGDNHIFALGDIVAQVQSKPSAEILSVWEDLIQNPSKKFKSGSLKSRSSSSFIHPLSTTIYKEKRQIDKDFYITRHLKSGKSSQNQSIDKQIIQIKPELIQVNQISSTIKQQTQNLRCFNRSSASSIGVENKINSEIRQSQNKQRHQDKNLFIKTQTIKYQNGLLLKQQKQKTMLDIKIDNNIQNKLEKLMRQMELKTIHLKKNSYSKQTKNITLLDNHSNIHSNRQNFDQNHQTINQNHKNVHYNNQHIHLFQQTENKNFKQKINQSPQQNLQIQQFIEPKYKDSIQTQINIESYQQKYSINSSFQGKQIQNIFTASNQNIYTPSNKSDKTKKCKSVIQFKDNSNITQPQNTYNIDIYKKKDETIEEIFKHLLQKHHKDKLQQVKNKPKYQNKSAQLIQKNNKSSNLQKFCQKIISQKSQKVPKIRPMQPSRPKFIQNVSLNKQNKQNMQPVNEDEPLGVSKISSKSIISNKSTFRKNSQIIQISKSNRTLRFQLRDRDLKISKLQEDLSKKQMELQIMYRKFQQLTNSFIKCNHCRNTNNLH